MTMTIREAQAWASSFLTKENIEQPQLESEVFIRSLFEWERSQLFVHWNDPISAEQLVQLQHWLTRRANHEPIHYIIGTQDFYGRTFQVNQNVLIPRPETELLVEAVLEQAKSYWGDRPLSVVDIGTGSGAISVTLALESPNWTIHTVDISEKAIEVAKENAKRLGAKVHFHQGSVLDPLIEKGIQVDLIVSNPPYIPSKDVQELMPDVRNYEPHLALDGGEDGLDFYREIIKQSKNVLKPKGIIAFEIGIDQSDAIQNLFKESGANNYKVIPDFQGIPRIAIARYE